MARQMRIQYENAWYHVMNRGAGGRYILSESNHKAILLDLIKEVKLKYGLEFYAYCIMDNHYHFLVRTPNLSLPEGMKYLQGIFTRIYNKNLNTDGPIFRGRYKSILLESDNSILQVCRYIHLNPVEANLESGINYYWSSYKYYLQNLQLVKPEWLDTNFILDYFESKNNNKSFIEFHQDSNTKKIMEFYHKTDKENFSLMSDSVL